MIFGLLDRDTGNTPGVIAPKVTLSFGGDLGGGLLGGLAQSVGLVGTGAGLEQGLLSLTISRGFAPAVDWAEVHLALVPGGATLPSLGEPGSINIQAADRASSFACNVDMVEHRPDGSVRLGLGNGGRILAQARLDTAYSDQSPGQIIDALCAQAGVDAAAGDSGEILPRYVTDGGTSVLDHIARLAASAGRLARFDDTGTLVLVDDTSAGEEILLAADDAIIDFRLTERADAGGVRITGAGSSEWAWLRKDAGPLHSQAGGPAPLRKTRAPWMRSPAGIQSLADAGGRVLSRDASPGRLLLGAYPDAMPGSIVALSGTAVDGPWRVMSSVMRFNPDRGFSNELKIARAETGAGAFGFGGLL